MGFRIVTINREFGSGGRTIGKEVAQRMGVTCYDEELVNQIAKESGMSKDFIKNSSEEASANTSFLFALNNWANSALTDQIYITQRKIIQGLAEKGPCVIVGRCADFFLRERDDCLNVFIHADMAFKKDRIVRLYGEKDDTPEKRITEKDKRRIAYYKYYTDRTWGMAENYHLCLDSGVLGIERCVDTILSFIEH